MYNTDSQNMYKNAVLAEILYCMSLRIKGGGISNKRIWTQKYVKWLESILKAIEISADLLEADRDITEDDIAPIVDFVKDNAGRLFPEVRIDIAEYRNESGKLILHKNNDWDEADDEIVSCMRMIAQKCREFLNNRGVGYKDEVQKLLTAFHNLPRAYLSRVYIPGSKATFLQMDYSRFAASKSEALEYSRLGLLC